MSHAHGAGQLAAESSRPFTLLSVACPKATGWSGEISVLQLQAIFLRIFLCFALVRYPGPCILSEVRFCGELKTMTTLLLLKRCDVTALIASALVTMPVTE